LTCSLVESCPPLEDTPVGPVPESGLSVVFVVLVVMEFLPVAPRV
jgi:hypothetical protein